MRSTILLLTLLLSASLLSAQQRYGYTPQGRVSNNQPSTTAPSSKFDVAKGKVENNGSQAVQPPFGDATKLKQNASELAALAESIPPDIDQTTKGILPKELDQKLKRIEKLAKQLRLQISR